jgi:apolipoprotein N-acyltransferase
VLPLRRRLADASLVALTVCLYAAAFPPFDRAALAWLALAPLLAVAARAADLRGAIGWGLLAGVGLGFTTAGWVREMIARFFEVGPVLAWAAFLALALALYGSWLALFSGFVRLAVRRGVAHPLVVAAGFGACEWARTSAPVPSPWALLGTSQAGFAALAQCADLAGPFGIGMLVAAGNACLAGLFVPALRPRRPFVAAGAVAGALAAVLGYGEWRLRQDFASGAVLEIAALQDADAGRAREGDGSVDLARRLALTERALAREADLVVWPELALRSSLHDASPASARLLAAAAASDADWLVGGPDATEWATRVDWTNSVFAIRGGRITGRYDKARLMPFAEENPLPAWLSSWRRPFTPGAPRFTHPLAVGDLRVGVMLCSEAMLPARARAAVADGAELLANPAYDAWFGSPAAALQQLRIAQLRAIESRRFVVRATTGGPAAAIDPHGRVLEKLPAGVSDVLLARVHAASATSPYQRIGDAVPIAGGAFAAASLVFPIAGRRRATQES